MTMREYGLPSGFGESIYLGMIYDLVSENQNPYIWITSLRTKSIIPMRLITRILKLSLVESVGNSELSSYSPILLKEKEGLNE
jgi:hypothetical protein